MQVWVPLCCTRQRRLYQHNWSSWHRLAATACQSSSACFFLQGIVEQRVAETRVFLRPAHIQQELDHLSRGWYCWRNFYHCRRGGKADQAYPLATQQLPTCQHDPRQNAWHLYHWQGRNIWRGGNLWEGTRTKRVHLCSENYKARSFGYHAFSLSS
jgi:hypothetical protein